MRNEKSELDETIVRLLFFFTYIYERKHLLWD